MKIALIQQKCTPKREANRQKGLEATIKAADLGAKVICFADLACDPFYPQIVATEDQLKLAEPVPGSTTEMFSRLAKELDIVIILNLFERDGNHTYDTSPVINTDGSLLGTTRMVHITDYDCFHERGYYYPGDHGAPVYHTKYGEIGVAICYDRHYPEYMRALALNGAEIVFVPQAGTVGEWPQGLYEAELQVAAFQNGYFTALCNRVGGEPKLTFAGGSYICDPDGKVIARADEGKDQILLSDVDLDKVKESHAKQLFIPDRRPELYADWLSKTK